MVTLWCTPYFFNNAQKCEPASLMMALGQPYQVKMHLVTNLTPPDGRLPSRDCYDPLGHIIHCYQDILFLV